MIAYKDEKRGTWFANFRYKHWRGKPRQKSKRDFRTKHEDRVWERDSRRRMSRVASMEFPLACDVYLTVNASRVRDTTLEQKRYYTERVLKPCFKHKIMDWKNHLLGSHTRRGTPHTATYFNNPLQPALDHHEPPYALLRLR